MKIKFSKQLLSKYPISRNYELKQVDKKGIKIRTFLSELLFEVMEASEDPDLNGRKPDIYLNNLENNKLGDFNRRYIITAKNEKEDVGLLIALPKDMETYHIYTLGVKPAYRQTGVGTQLLKQCINDMIDSGQSKLIIDVHSLNKPARLLYEKLEFKEECQ